MEEPNGLWLWLWLWLWQQQLAIGNWHLFAVVCPLPILYMPPSVSPFACASGSGSGSALSVYAFLVSFAFASHYNCKQLKSIYANFQDMQTANGQPHRNRNHATPSWAPAPNCLLPAACSRAPYASPYMVPARSQCSAYAAQWADDREDRERERVP